MTSNSTKLTAERGGVENRVRGRGVERAAVPERGAADHRAVPGDAGFGPVGRQPVRVDVSSATPVGRSFGEQLQDEHLQGAGADRTLNRRLIEADHRAIHGKFLDSQELRSPGIVVSWHPP